MNIKLVKQMEDNLLGLIYRFHRYKELREAVVMLDKYRVLDGGRQARVYHFRPHSIAMRGAIYAAENIVRELKAMKKADLAEKRELIAKRKAKLLKPAKKSARKKNATRIQTAIKKARGV